MPSSLPISVQDLLFHRGVESTRVEFKSTWDGNQKDKKSPSADQILRSICAFANDLQNLNGGYILIGVEEDPGGRAKLPPKGLSDEQAEKAEKTLRQWCQDRLDPLYLPVFSKEIVDGQLILAIWAAGGQNRPYQVPISSERGAERSYFVRVGADSVDARKDPALLSQLLQLTAKVPFDDRRALDASLLDLRENAVREFLHDIGSGLAEEPDAPTIYRNMRIVERVNGHEVPRNIGLLFFSSDPSPWFPGAAIRVGQFAGTESGDIIDERVFERQPIIEQLRSCLSFLEGLTLRQIRKVPGKLEAEHWVSFPQLAMREALVNAVYHRSYERDCPDPIQIRVLADRLEITSYPGPLPGIEPHHFHKDGVMPQLPARNRRIGELLKQLQLAESWNTGILKVRRAMLQNGSPPPIYDFDAARTYFRVTLPAHPNYHAILALQQVAELRATGDRQAAFHRLHEAFLKAPSNPNLALEMAKAEIERDNLPGAIEVYERLQAASPDLQANALLNLLARAHLDRGDSEGAKIWMDLFEEPDSFEDAFEAAIHEHRAQRLERAHQLFESTGSSVLGDPKALHEFAQVKLKLGKKALDAKNPAAKKLLDEARALLERVVQMDAPRTRHAWAYFNLGQVLRLRSAPLSDARRAFAKAVELQPEEPRFSAALEELPGG